MKLIQNREKNDLIKCFYIKKLQAFKKYNSNYNTVMLSLYNRYVCKESAFYFLFLGQYLAEKIYIYWLFSNENKTDRHLKNKERCRPCMYLYLVNCNPT